MLPTALRDPPRAEEHRSIHTLSAGAPPGGLLLASRPCGCVASLRERGYGGGYTAVKRAVPRHQAGADQSPLRCASRRRRASRPRSMPASLAFTDEPGVTRIVWLFSMVLGFSRLIWARFVAHQDLQTVLRCHIAALEAIGGAPHEILYDRMKTAVIGATPEGKQELVGFQTGVRESAQTWRELLIDIKRRALGPKSRRTLPPAMARSASGRQSRDLPGTRHQRCWVHKTANVLNKVALSIQVNMKADLRAFYGAPTRVAAAQDGLQVLVVTHRRPDKTREAEHHGEQPDDAGDTGLSVNASSKRGRLTWACSPGGVSKRTSNGLIGRTARFSGRVTAAIASLTHPPGGPGREARIAREALPQIGCTGPDSPAEPAEVRTTGGSRPRAMYRRTVLRSLPS